MRAKILLHKVAKFYRLLYGEGINLPPTVPYEHGLSNLVTL